jgi:hypothetical protein
VGPWASSRRTRSGRRFAAVLVAAVVAFAAPSWASAAPGDVFVADPGRRGAEDPGAVLRGDASGAGLVAVASGPPFSDPTGIAVDVDGALLVADAGGAGPGSLLRIDPLTAARAVLAAGGPLVEPRGVVVDPNGDPYVVDEGPPGGTGAVLSLDPFTRRVVPIASGSPLVDPSGIAALADGRLALSDPGAFGSGAVLVVDPFEGAVTRLASVVRPTAITAAPDGSLLVTTRSGRLIRVDAISGAQRPIAARRPLVDPRGIAVAASGDLLVTVGGRPGRGALVRLSLAAGVTATAASAPLREPRGVAVGPNRPPLADLEVTPNPALPNETVTFDASLASDPDGPLASYAWDLDGDGSFETSTGGSPTVSRVYPEEAEIEVGVRVTDVHGASDETTTFLVVGDLGLEGELDEEGEARRDRVAPALSRLRVVPRRFRAARRGASNAAGRRARVRYRLSEAARVTFRVRRRVAGGRGCARSRRARRCVRSRPVPGALVQRGRRGRNVLRLGGRTRGRSLPRGDYVLVARARDASGNRSRVRRARFRVLSRHGRATRRPARVLADPHPRPSRTLTRCW